MKESVSFFHWTLIVVIGTFEFLGVIMIYYTMVKEKLIKRWREESFKEWYADWEKRKKAATEKGLEFNDPPPPRLSNNQR